MTIQNNGKLIEQGTLYPLSITSTHKKTSSSDMITTSAVYPMAYQGLSSRCDLLLSGALSLSSSSSFSSSSVIYTTGTDTDWNVSMLILSATSHCVCHRCILCRISQILG